MVGQGSPQSNTQSAPSKHKTKRCRQPRSKIARLALLAMSCLFGVVLVCANLHPAHSQTQSQLTAAAQSHLPSFRLRVSWGGGQNQSWRGSIATDRGTVSNITPLGLTESLANTATRINDRQINILQKVATNYDGFDFTFQGDLNSTIAIELAADDDPESKFQKTLSIASLIQAAFQNPLDDLGNHLSIDRAPGDVVEVQLDRDHLVIDSGETMSVDVALNHSALKPGQANLRMSLVTARQRDPATWSQTKTIDINDAGSTPDSTRFQFEAPSEEGVYDLLIEVERNWLGINNAVINSAANNKTIRALDPQHGLIRRRVQFVVLQDQPKQPQTADAFAPIGEIVPEKIVPSGTNWRLQSQKQKLAVLGNQKSALTQLDDQPLVEVLPGGWQALRLPTLELGKPHIVEIDYPADQAMALGVSILDQSDQGQVPLQGADSGIHIPDSIVVDNSSQPLMARHRVTFWPNSKNVYLLLANQSADNTARFGGVKVLAGPDELDVPDNTLKPHRFSGRKRMAWYQSPSFMDDFSVQKFFDPAVGQPLDDWVAFYQGTSRLIEYLKQNHYQGAVLSVTADGSSIYPDVYSKNTPAHDTGIFLSDGQDPFRKDVLRMMLKMFERENLTLIPAFSFSHPLIDIEANRDGSLSPQAFDLVDQSQNLPQSLEKQPRYNPLSESVQVSVLKTLRQFVERYRGVSSLGGITLICQPNTYAMLAGDQWAHNPHTIDRFMTSFDAESLDQSGDHWIQWRADQMTHWYQAIADLVDRNIDGGQLFIAPVGLYDNEEAFSALCPNLHATVNFEQLLKRFGFDRVELMSDPRIVLLNPQTLTTAETLSASRVHINVNASGQAHDFFASGSQTGTIFNHRGLWAHFAQLQSQAPFHQQAGRLIRRIQLTPTGKWNRQRFSSAIRQQDSLYLIDGGTGIPQGQEESLRHFASTFAMLPRVRFSDVKPHEDESSPAIDESLIVRQAQFEGNTYLYALNDSPWEVTVAIPIGEPKDEVRQVGMIEPSDSNRAPTAEYFPLTDADGRQIFNSNTGILAISLPPFSIAGGKLTGTKMSATSFAYQVDQNIEPLLRKKTYALQAKLNLAKNSPPLTALNNAGFEEPPLQTASGWDTGDQAADKVLLDKSQGHESETSLKLMSQGDPVWIRSNRFNVPNTGRLSVTAYLKVEDLTNQPPLRIAVEGETQNSTYYRFGNVGSLAPEAEAKQINGQWRRFAVHFNDLPNGELRDLRIGFDLMDKGTVWIDNVSVHDRWFDGNDAKAMTQLLAGAAPLMDNPSSFEGCRRVLESYWPRFLDEHIEIESAAANPEKALADEAGAPPTSNGDNIFKRVKSSSPSLLRRWRSNLPQR